MDWGKAMCGYEDPDPAIMSEATASICTMCVEAGGGGPDGPMATRHCPVDGQPCPDDETMDRTNLPPLTPASGEPGRNLRTHGAHDQQASSRSIPGR